MMTPKQNALESIYGGKPEYVPLSHEDVQLAGMASLDQEAPLMRNGTDIFGVPWVATKEGSIPKPGFMLFDDVTEWEKHVKIPDVASMDFKAMAEAEINRRPPSDGEEKLVEIMDGLGPFQRLVSFMTFEEALCALVMEPQACMDFFEAVTEYKIAYINKSIDAYNPDIYCLGDDNATARGLFMSPETFRKLIKPYWARMAEAVTKRGVLFNIHDCGKCEDIIPDMVEIGVSFWQSAQPMNDLAGILDKYRGQLAVEGGWDSSGPPSYIGADEEMIRAEVRRCLTEYKKPGFFLWPSIINERGNSVFVGDDRLGALKDEWLKYRMF
ncbi:MULTISPECIES: uroporphyrinogen decarboxylase family protein [Dehalobacter]|jgi:hypothetical protein|uniref:Uroporphyrinogen decarboxylase (URO-D) domain-containing protein n=2 Tax=Dehalobacter restrictus TaxID=55583 RepID=A0A857DMG7_9FIRM|nr:MULTISPECIES: uroporphyrinogen decarboxylase family protein [Dehalobacter]MCG1026367.1 hypothetical protein [Dehalobacter sp.]MDJ0305509.1 hypothetical protein [Dehalobacter sp.]QHA01286.1 hypothetical protein GQ588_11870 [Dehalobacter restrictus]